MVAALEPRIGYGRATEFANNAYAEGATLRDAAVASLPLRAEQFDAWVGPAALTGR